MRARQLEKNGQKNDFYLDRFSKYLGDFTHIRFQSAHLLSSNQISPTPEKQTQNAMPYKCPLTPSALADQPSQHVLPRPLRGKPPSLAAHSGKRPVQG